MFVPRVPHRWSVTPRRAIEIQRQMAARVIDRGRVAGPALVAGADLAFSRDGSRCIAGVIVWNVERACVVERRTAQRRVAFPYVPGLLSFREVPALLAAIRALRTEPDVFIFDGQGFAHPRRFGLACHIGVIVDRPSIGCAKSRLIGRCAAPGPNRGDTAALLDDRVPLAACPPAHSEANVSLAVEAIPLSLQGRGAGVRVPAPTDVPSSAPDGQTRRDAVQIGAVLRTRDNVKPVYVSVGHRISLDEAVRIVLACTTRYRLPEPTRLADRYVAALRAAT